MSVQSRPRLPMMWGWLCDYTGSGTAVVVLGAPLAWRARMWRACVPCDMICVRPRAACKVFVMFVPCSLVPSRVASKVVGA